METQGIGRNAMLRLSRAMDTDKRNGQGDGVNGPAVSQELAKPRKVARLEVNESSSVAKARELINAL
jgi:hypothetical protein